MADQTTQSPTELVAELNDLLQLDHDAVQAYTLAISRLTNERYKQTITRFRSDHERHISELTNLIRDRGGAPAELPHLSTSPFKLAVQGVGAAGGDKGILLAFKSNERLSRDKYRRAANMPHQPEVTDVLARAAQDELTHYTWVVETLEDLGVGGDTTVGKLGNAFETAHAKTADAVEGAGKTAATAAEGVRRGGLRRVTQNPLRSAVIAAAVGLVAAGVFRRAR